MNQNRKKTLGVIGSGVGVMMIALVALMAGSGVAADNDQPAEPSAPSLKVVSPGSGPSQFAVLQPATDSSLEALPEHVSRALAWQAFKHNGHSAGEIGAIGSSMLGIDTSVTFAELGKTLCVVMTYAEDPEGAFGSCWPLSEAAAGGAYLALRGAEGSVRLVGLAPNPVTDVIVGPETDTKADVSASVSANLWTTDIAPAETQITGLNQSGEPVYNLDLPLEGLQASPAEGQ